MEPTQTNNSIQNIFNSLIVHKRIIFFILTAFFLGSGMTFFLVKKSTQKERPFLELASPTQIMVNSPTSTPPITNDSLEQCLVEANKIINEWRASCTGPNCEGADLIDDPRLECYKKFGQAQDTSSFLVPTNFVCPSIYKKTCEYDKCYCKIDTTKHPQCNSSADCPAGAPCQNGYCVGVDYTQNQ